MYKKTKMLYHCFVLLFSISLIAYLPAIEAAQGGASNNVCNCKGYSGVGGPCYSGIGGTGNSCPAICK